MLHYLIRRGSVLWALWAAPADRIGLHAAAIPPVGMQSQHASKQHASSIPTAPEGIHADAPGFHFIMGQDVEALVDTARAAARLYSSTIQRHQQLASTSEPLEGQVPQPLLDKQAEVLQRLQVGVGDCSVCACNVTSGCRDMRPCFLCGSACAAACILGHCTAAAASTCACLQPSERG